MIIDCDACAVRDLECGDCVVSVLLGMPSVRGAAAGPAGPAEPPGAGSGVSRIDLELDRREQAAIAVLAAHGLVPPLRLVPAETGPEPEPEVTGEPRPRRAAG